MADQAATAIGAVGSEMLAGSAASIDMSLMGMFMQADLLVKAVMIILIFCSFWCWVIIFEKSLAFRRAKNMAARFERDFWSAQELDSFYDRMRKKRAAHPMAQIFLAAMEEWYRSQKNPRSSSQKSGTMHQQLGLRERMSQVMSVSLHREMDRLSSGIGVLASVGSAAPFIGLFGTVWGIMNSFQSIALSQNTSLAVVAPGIAEALFATAIGLFAAIPAVLAYNRFAGELDKFEGRLEDFTVEFNTLLSRQFDR